MFTCIDSRSSKRHEQVIQIIGSPSSPKSPTHKIGMNQGDDDDTIDDESSNTSLIVEEDEPWAVRFAEMFRLEVA